MTMGSMNYKFGSDKDTLTDLASGWFTGEHSNGKYWGWMKFINKFEMPPPSDMYVKNSAKIDVEIFSR